MAPSVQNPYSMPTHAMPQNPVLALSTGAESSAGGQVATSIQAANAAIPPPRPSWMAINHPRSPVTASNEPIRPSTVTSRKPRQPPKRAKASPKNVRQQNISAAQCVSNPVDRAPQTASVGIEPWPQTVLPSPALTDEPSPVVSSQNGSPGQTAYCQIDGPINGQIAPHRGPLSREGGTGPAAVNAVMPNPNPTAHVDPSTQNGSINIQDMGRPHTSQPIPHQALQSPPQESNECFGSAPISESRSRPPDAANSAESAPKRRRLDGPTFMKQWHEILTAHSMQYGRSNSNGDLNSVRLGLLLAACEKGDLFFVALHQVLCIWTFDRSLAYQIFTPTFQANTIDIACEILESILRKNEGLSDKDLQWLSHFPAQIHELVQKSDAYNRILQDVAIFLRNLATSYHTLMALVHRRRVPFLAFETIYGLRCPSGDLQFMLFTVSRRSLGVVDGRIASELSILFNKDQMFERDAFASNANLEDVQRNRQDYAARYAHLVRQAQPRQSQFQQPLPLPTTVFVPPSNAQTVAATPVPMIQEAVVPPNVRPRAANNAPPTPMNQPHSMPPNAQIQMANSAPPTPTALGHPLQPGRPNMPNLQIPTTLAQPANPSGLNAPVLQNSQTDNHAMRQSGPYEYQAQSPAPQVAPPQTAYNPMLGHSWLAGGEHGPPQQGFVPSPVSQVPPDGPMPVSFQYQIQLTTSVRDGQSSTPHAAPPEPHGLQAPQHFSRPSPTQAVFSPQHLGMDIAWANNMIQASQPDRQMVMVAPIPSPGSPLQASASQAMPSQAMPSQVLPSQVLPSQDLPSQMPQQIPQQMIAQMPPHQQQQPFSSHSYTIPPNEYALGPYDLSSVQMGLHQVQLRSPRRTPRDPSVMRYYQFIGRFATHPMELQPRMGLRTLTFSVSPTEASNISQKLDSMNMPFSKYHEGSLRYRLRLCMRPEHETFIQESDWVLSKNHWPAHIMFEVNGKPMDLRRKQHFSKDLPLELSPFIVSDQNRVRISFPPVEKNLNLGQKCFVAVEVVETRSYSTLRTMIETSQRTPSSETREKVRHRLRPTESDDIIVEDQLLPVSIADPFSLATIEIPVRGLECQHLECFDLDTWLQTRPCKPKQKGGVGLSGGEPSEVDKWNCPICKLDARPASLRVDEFFVQVLLALLGAGNTRVKSIMIDGQGGWTPVYEADERKKKHEGEGSNPRTAAAEVIELFD